MVMEGGRGDFLGSTMSLELSILYLLGIWSSWRPLGAGKFVPVVWVGDDDMWRVLMGLRERCEDFLFPGPSFRTSRLGLLEYIWLELCLNGKEGKGGGVSDGS